MAGTAVATTNNNTFTLFQGLPAWAKGLIAVIILIFFIVVIWVIYKNTKGKGQDTIDVRDVNEDLDAMIKNGVKPSYPDSQYAGWSAKLADAFSGCGTTYGSILSVMMNMKNRVDVLKLISIYGIRKYDACGLGNGDNEYSLPRAMESELDTEEMNQVNLILAGKGINYKF